MTALLLVGLTTAATAQVKISTYGTFYTTSQFNASIVQAMIDKSLASRDIEITSLKNRVQVLGDSLKKIRSVIFSQGFSISSSASTDTVKSSVSVDFAAAIKRLYDIDITPLQQRVLVMELLKDEVLRIDALLKLPIDR